MRKSWSAITNIVLVGSVPICLAGCPNAQGLTCDGTDQTDEINELLASAPSGSTIWFTSDVPCKITGPLIIPQPLTLTTSPGAPEKAHIIRTDENPDHPGRYPACDVGGGWGNHPNGAIFDIQSSDVTITDLRLTGAEYGPIGCRNTHGIWAYQPDERFSRITIRDCELSQFRGRGIGLTNVEHFVIEDNHIEDVGFGGIMIENGRVGRIHDNTVFDVANPAVVDPAPGCEACNESENACPSGNCDFCDIYNSEIGVPSTYSIVVSGCHTEDDCSEDVIISNNTVKHNRSWAGIMNHGGQRVLVVDNLVEDTDILYANTVNSPDAGVPLQASSGTWFVNNVGDAKPCSGNGCNDVNDPEVDAWYNPTTHGVGQWFVGGTIATIAATQDVAAIGNVYINCGYHWQESFDPDEVPTANPCVDIFPVDGVIFTHNEIYADYPLPSSSSVRLLKHPQYRGGSVSNAVFAHNKFLHGYPAGIRSEIRGESVLVTNNFMTYNNPNNMGMTTPTPYAVYLAKVPAIIGGTWDIQDNQAANEVFVEPGVKYGVVDIQESVPETPTLVAFPSFVPDQVELRWDGYPDRNGPDEDDKHDSFYIFDYFGGEFRRVAYRPPNDSRWKFMSENTDFVPFDTLGYVVSDLESGTHWFGIRAQNGSTNSGLSVVQVIVP